jgi:hypothetical protein|tara:strand:+ start:462 stop:935 length:474 start_codon:yes stop_codon:yes gene_type:complete
MDKFVVGSMGQHRASAMCVGRPGYAVRQSEKIVLFAPLFQNPGVPLTPASSTLSFEEQSPPNGQSTQEFAVAFKKYKDLRQWQSDCLDCPVLEAVVLSKEQPMHSLDAVAPTLLLQVSDVHSKHGEIPAMSLNVPERQKTQDAPSRSTVFPCGQRTH